MAHAQKPDFVFRLNGPSPFKSAGGASVHSTTGSRGVRIIGSNAGYTMFRGSVKGTGYPPHSPVYPSLPLPCVTVCHHISAGLCYDRIRTQHYNCTPFLTAWSSLPCAGGGAHGLSRHFLLNHRTYFEHFSLFHLLKKHRILRASSQPYLCKSI